jgi:hypothetical protein
MGFILMPSKLEEMKIQTCVQKIWQGVQCCMYGPDSPDQDSVCIGLCATPMGEVKTERFNCLTGETVIPLPETL